MASAERALRGLTRSDPVPTDGAGFLSYVGGKQVAWQALSGLPGKPRAADYAGGASSAAYQRDNTTWRNAQRWVQRHTAPEGKQRREAVTLAPEQRRRVQAANRGEKREAVARHGIAVSLTGQIRAGRDVRTRTIGVHSPVMISAARTADILAALRDEGREAAEAELWEAFCDELGWDAGDDYFSVSGGSWSAAAA